MIELIGDLKVFDTFHLSPIGELVGYNEKFQPQEVYPTRNSNLKKLL